MILSAAILSLFFDVIFAIMMISAHITTKRPIDDFKKSLPYYIIILIIAWCMMFIGFYEYGKFLF